MIKQSCFNADLVDEIENLAEIKTEIELLGKPTIPSPLQEQHYPCFVSDADRVLAFASIKNLESFTQSGEAPSFELAGPRSEIFFDPTKTRCAIVTCGGLCPGINNVIRAIVMTSHYSYGINSVIGIKYGFRGFIPKYKIPVEELTPQTVDRIHEYGGTILGSSRGHQPIDGIVDSLERMNINILFVIGGDGTFRAASLITEEIKKRGLKISVIAIPKTIDNDIFLVSQTFGFITAVEMACQTIQCAHTEAIGAPNCIGLVKLMGRYSGFIAAAATSAQREVNFCLVPESDFDLHGEKGLLKAIEQRLDRRSHAVIVVAEGAGQKFFDEEKLGRDPSGNLKLGDIGTLLKNEIKHYFQEIGKEVYIRYIDPSYIVRSVPANVDDSLYCGNLGQNAVHAAMAGKTGMMVSLWNDRYIHVPIESAIMRRKQINLRSRFWMSVLEATGQNSLKNDD